MCFLHDLTDCTIRLAAPLQYVIFSCDYSIMTKRFQLKSSHSILRWPILIKPCIYVWLFLLPYFCVQDLGSNNKSVQLICSRRRADLPRNILVARFLNNHMDKRSILIRIGDYRQKEDFY